MLSFQRCFAYLALLIVGVEGGLRALKYDTECPFLTDREYIERMKRGRCPYRVEQPST
jgi:hypothetical protein